MPSIKNKNHKARCQAYRASGRREKNKAAKIKRHLLRFPDDKVAQERLSALPGGKG